jgi:hypothetical protein
MRQSGRHATPDSYQKCGPKPTSDR